MGLLEKMITASIIVVFIFLLFNVSNVEVYDCSQLNKHKHVPEAVFEECLKLYRPINSISI